MDDLLLDALLALGLCLPRTGMAMIFMPFTRMVDSARMLKSAIAIACCIPLVPTMMPLVAEAHDPIWWLGMILKEAAVGAALALAFATPLWAMEAAGILIDNQRGAAVAEMFNQESGTDTSPFGILFQQTYLVLYLSLGGLNAFLDACYSSYGLWPVDQLLPQIAPGNAELVLALFDSLFRMAVLTAAPVLIAMLLGEVSLALASIFAPQLQVFPLAMGIKSGIAVMVLLVYATVLVHLMSSTVVSSSGTGWLIDVLRQR